jgi:hypothetical protein
LWQLCIHTVANKLHEKELAANEESRLSWGEPASPHNKYHRTNEEKKKETLPDFPTDGIIVSLPRQRISLRVNVVETSTKTNLMKSTTA